MTWLVFFEEFDCVKPCKFAVRVSIDKKTKTKKTNKDIKQREKQNFVALGDLVKSTKKVFIDGMMKRFRGKVMLLRLTTMGYFLSRKEQESVVFVKEEFLHFKTLLNMRK